MEKKEIRLEYAVCGKEELMPADAELVEAAMQATDSSYAPYSGFCVGAAVRLSDGSIIQGSNQENAAYPSGLCAERTALFRAGAEKPWCQVTALAIAARVGNAFTSEPVTPCGACRQVMAECETRYGTSIKTLLYGNERVLVIDGTDRLLPFCFNSMQTE